MKDQFTRWARRINEAIADRSKADTAITKFLNEFHQMVHGTSESVEPPDHKRVAFLQLCKASFQLRAVPLCSRDLLGEDV